MSVPPFGGSFPNSKCWICWDILDGSVITTQVETILFREGRFCHKECFEEKCLVEESYSKKHALWAAQQQRPVFVEATHDFF